MSILPDDIPVDENISGYDPEIDDTASSAFTVSSTLYDFSYENGRRYPSYRYGSHPFPHDDLSTKNDKILHHMLLYLFDNRLFLAPVKNPLNILDVRHLQGLWAQNIADAFPDSHVVAMDTNPMPRSTYPNLDFVVQSFNDEWVLDDPNMKFDFIYARNLFGAANEFGLFYKQVFDNLIPGGYFEQFEIEIKPRYIDDSEKAGNAIRRLTELTPQLSNAFGTEYNIAMSMKELINAAGFVDIQETRLRLPLGPWSADQKYKQVGEWFEAFYKSGLQGWIMAPLTRIMKMDPEQVNEWCEEAFKEVDSREQHIYFTAVVIHCRKPG